MKQSEIPDTVPSLQKQYTTLADTHQIVKIIES